MEDASIGWIAAIIIGGVAGWLAERFMKSEMGLLMNIILGIVGAFIANLILGLVGVTLAGWLGWRGHLYGVFVRSWTGVRIRDVQSEFKLFRREILARIPIQSDGPAVHTEVLAKMNFLNAFMYEVPITYRAENGPEIEWKEIMSELRRVLANPEFGAPLPSPAS